MSNNNNNNNSTQKNDQKPKETGYGIVKAANTGDSIILMQMRRDGPPAEREVSLSMIRAPWLGRRGDKDEAWGWESRQFLRSVALGKQATFTIDFKNPETGREYGMVKLGSLDLIYEMASKGWAEVRRPPDGKEPRSDYHADLIKASEAAKEQGIGIFRPESEAGAFRPTNLKFEPMKLYDRLKFKPLKAVVEHVRDGSTLRVDLLPTHYSILLRLSGAQCNPVPYKKPDGTWSLPNMPPYCREAKLFTEQHALHRTVEVCLRSIGKNDEFTGTVKIDSTRDLASGLISVGLAKFVDWNAPPDLAQKMKSLQQQAQSKKMRLWKNYNAATAKANKDEYDARVYEIQNGGSIVVVDEQDNKNTIFLSCIKVPRLGGPNKDGTQRPDEPYAFEAKETLRAALIGKKVHVVRDYVKQKIEIEGRVIPEKTYCSVFAGKRDAAQTLLENGFARIATHGDEARSRNFEQLVLAEKRAIAKRKNIHRARQDQSVHHYQDYTNRDKSKLAKDRLPFLKRAGEVTAIVDYVFSGARLKLYLPKEQCMIMFGIEGIKCPRRGDEFFEESQQFAKDRLLQRSVSITISTIDKGGSFIGSLTSGKKKNFALAILEAGLASAFGSFSEAYKQAENNAKDNKKNLWQNYDREEEERKRQAKKEEMQQQKQQVKQSWIIRVTEVMEGGWFYVHQLPNNTATQPPQLDNLMLEINATEPKPFINTFEITKGALALTKFDDGQWYRVRIEKTYPNKQADVTYIDYGNKDKVSFDKLCSLDAQFASLPPQAIECGLAFLKVPSYTKKEEFGQEAAYFFKDLAWDKTMSAIVEYKEGNKSYLNCGDPQTKTWINKELTEAGFATVATALSHLNTDMVTELLTFQEEARAARLNLWQYGDIIDDDEDY